MDAGAKKVARKRQAAYRGALPDGGLATKEEARKKTGAGNGKSPVSETRLSPIVNCRREGKVTGLDIGRMLNSSLCETGTGVKGQFLDQRNNFAFAAQQGKAAKWKLKHTKTTSLSRGI